MRKIFNRAIKSDLVKVSSMNGVANLIKILTSLISSKITAVYLGPSGVALLGQFQNISSMALSLATMGINGGVTKYSAQYFDAPVKRHHILSSGFILTMVGSLLIAPLLFIFREQLAVSVLHEPRYAWIFGVLAITVTFFAMNTFFVSILNGYKDFKSVTAVNISNSIVGLALAILLVIKFGLSGAFVGVVLSQTLVFFVTLFFITKAPWFSFSYLTSGVHKESAQKLLKFSLMAFTSLFAVTFIQLQIRSYLIRTLSIEDAGYWQGIVRISDIYLTFITSTLSIYYLPRLSEIKDKGELRRELFKGYKFILPLAILSSLAIYFSRELIVHLLLAKSFSPMLPLFLWQLVGNVLKIASWLLGYLLLAKAMTKVFIITELAFGLSLYVLTVFCVARVGVVGATYAYAINYFLYLLIMIYLFRDILFQKIHGFK